MKNVILLVLLVSVTSAFASELSYEQAKALADKDEASLSSELMQSLIAAQGKAGSEAHAVCLTPETRQDSSPYTVVMELNSTGKVVRTWLHGNSPLAICFDREMSQKSLFVPPHAPFYTAFEMTWRH